VDEVRRLLMAEVQRVIPFDAAQVLLGDAAAGEEWAASRDLIASVRSSGRPDYTDSALCAPIRMGEKVLGVVVVGRSAGGSSFTAGDEKLLLVLTSQAGVALERARLHEQEARRLQLEQELAVARRIQLSLLPQSPPQVPGWTFVATYEAARQVGGDFYDFVVPGRPEDGVRRLGLVIADVTGKGVPAALVMAYSRAVVRAEAAAGSSPREVLANTNQVIMRDRQSSLFLSAFYTELDLDSGTMTYASAGHDAPLLVRWDGGGNGHASGLTGNRAAAHSSVSELEARGVVLGAFADMGLEEKSAVLGPGDLVVLYTDGVTEARNRARELFGEERLRAVVAESAAGGAQAVIASVTTAVARFTAGEEQADDLTIVVFQRERT
jgi:sigma-B regulation protein RsbU (phosphoserine phosphatase)